MDGTGLCTCVGVTQTLEPVPDGKDDNVGSNSNGGTVDEDSEGALFQQRRVCST